MKQKRDLSSIHVRMIGDMVELEKTEPLLQIQCPSCGQQLLASYTVTEIKGVGRIKDSCSNCNTIFEYWHSKVRGIQVKKI